MLYKYPQREFPYAQLVEENRRRGKDQPEFELLDTGIFDDDRYFDVFVEYAKAAPDDILMRVTVHNRGPEAAHDPPAAAALVSQHLVVEGRSRRSRSCRSANDGAVVARARRSGRRTLLVRGRRAGAAVLRQRDQRAPPVRRGRRCRATSRTPSTSTSSTATHAAVNPAAARHQGRARTITLDGAGAAASTRVRLRLQRDAHGAKPFADFDARRRRSAVARPTSSTRDLQAGIADADARRVQRQAFAGHDLEQAVLLLRRAPSGCTAIPAQPPPPPSARSGRNRDWPHLNNADIISMPDKWEYPWYAAWDLAFHCIPLALVDPEFAKQQLVLLTREWYMHPNGQLPAYEWAFGDVNPPVHAWATWRVFQIDRKQRGDDPATSRSSSASSTS